VLFGNDRVSRAGMRVFSLRLKLLLSLEAAAHPSGLTRIVKPFTRIHEIHRSSEFDRMSRRMSTPCAAMVTLDHAP
jgi:hypothetical protein